jgi:peroxiredoxin
LIHKEANMARNTTRPLDHGDAFPVFRVSLVDGGTAALPADFGGRWTVILGYRGHWCPYCRQQLADFQRTIEEFTKRNVAVIALSVDPLDEARKTVERHHLTFPIGYGVDGPAFAAHTGAFFDEAKKYVQATGFIVQPDGLVAEAVYSTGPVGRYTASDVLGLIDYLSTKAPQTRSAGTMVR